MCLENIIGISHECEKSKSGLYLSDIPMLQPIITKCCSDYKNETQHRIDTAAKLVKNELLIFSSTKLQPRQPNSYKIGYRYANLTREGKSKYAGCVVAHRSNGDGTVLELDWVRIPTPSTIQINIKVIENGSQNIIFKKDVKTNERVDIGIKTTDEITIYYETVRTQLVMDACTCKGWTDKFDRENPYYYKNSRKAPAWSKDVMVAGVEFDDTADITGEYSKEINMEIGVSVGCDPSGWICLENYKDTNPLHIMIANALLNMAGSLLMQAVFSDTAISRSNLIAKEYASEAAVHLDEQYQFYIEKIIDYVETNHEQIDFCMICKSCIKKRWNHGLLK